MKITCLDKQVGKLLADLYNAKTPEAKAKCLQEFQKNKLSTKRPVFAEFEPGFVELRYSTKMTKQRGIIRYVLNKLYQAKSTGLPLDPEQATIEHLAPENPTKQSGLSDETVASIGNLILINQTLNNQLANKSFGEKVKLLGHAKVWVDPVILNAKTWGAPEIEKRARLLAKEAYDKVWKL